MTGENNNSPHQPPEDFRGLDASDLLSSVKTIESIARLERLRNQLLELMFKRDLTEDEKDLWVGIELRTEAIYAREREDVAILADIAKKEAEQEKRQQDAAFSAIVAQLIQDMPDSPILKIPEFLDLRLILPEGTSLSGVLKDDGNWFRSYQRLTFYSSLKVVMVMV